MINRLAGMRKARGISAVDLAAQVGVTRQAVYAIEAGTYMPNTAVALRLARVLDTSVEDLFALEEEEKPAGDVRSFEPLDETFSFEPGSRFRSAMWDAARSVSLLRRFLRGCRWRMASSAARARRRWRASPTTRTGC